MWQGGFNMVDKELEKYVNNYLEKDCKLNWINYSIVMANNYPSQTIFVRYKNEILIYINDKFTKKISIKKRGN